jgi:hypothetical protein
MLNMLSLARVVIALVLIGLASHANAWWFCPLGGPNHWLRNAAERATGWNDVRWEWQLRLRGSGYDGYAPPWTPLTIPLLPPLAAPVLAPAVAAP